MSSRPSGRTCRILRPAEFHLNVAQSSAHYYGTDDASAFGASPTEIAGALDAYRAAARIPPGGRQTCSRPGT